MRFCSIPCTIFFPNNKVNTIWITRQRDTPSGISELRVDSLDLHGPHAHPLEFPSHQAHPIDLHGLQSHPPIYEYDLINFYKYRSLILNTNDPVTSCYHFDLVWVRKMREIKEHSIENHINRVEFDKNLSRISFRKQESERGERIWESSKSNFVVLPLIYRQ